MVYTVIVDLEPILGWSARQEYILNGIISHRKVPYTHIQTNTHIYGQFSIANPPYSKFLQSWKKLENLEKTHRDTCTEHAQKLHKDSNPNLGLIWECLSWMIAMVLTVPPC